MSKRSLLGLILCALCLVRCRQTPPQVANDQGPHYVWRQPGNKRAVVFVHGILGSATGTWTSTHGAYFPDLVAKDPDLPGSDVYVYEYPSRALSGPFTLPEIAASMESRLRNDKVFEDHEEIIFVCHSMGGLVTLQLLLTFRPLASKVPLLALYSTPQSGAEIARLGSIFKNPQLEAMIPGDDNQFLENLERQWKVAGFRTTIRCVYERRPTKGVLVVDRNSGTRLCEGSTVPIDADHVGIVKPENRNQDSYIALRNWVLDLQARPTPTTPPSIQNHQLPAPTPAPTPAMGEKPSLVTPKPMLLFDVLRVLQEQEEVTIVPVGCPDSLLSAKVPRGTYKGENLKELLDNIRLRIEGPEVRFKVQVVREGLRYEIKCE
jgi:pimeloyl-ACP methyl ester carboxylesterase